MLQVNLETLAVANVPLPDFLIGLADESLLDLSWTGDESVMEYGWWPVVKKSPKPRLLEKLSAEVYTADVDRKVVVAKREIIQWTEPDLLEYKTSLMAEIDQAVYVAGEKKQRFAVEYQRREAQARSYLNAISSSGGARHLPVPTLVAGFATAAGMPTVEAAKLIAQQADELYEKMDTLANLRMRKYEVLRAATPEQARASYVEVMGLIAKVAATLT